MASTARNSMFLESDPKVSVWAGRSDGEGEGNEDIHSVASTVRSTTIPTISTDLDMGYNAVDAREVMLRRNEELGESRADLSMLSVLVLLD
jgi:hypothetical protein